MRSSLPAPLISDICSRRVLPVVGYGYPDLTTFDPLQTDATEEGIIEWIATVGPHVWPLFHAIASIPCDSLIALTPDDDLQRILQFYDPQWMMLHLQQAEYSPEKRLVLPLLGTLDLRGTLIPPDKDCIVVPSDRRVLWDLAESFSARKRLLILGCNPADHSILRLLARLQPFKAFGKKGWLICSNPALADKEAWEARGFEVVKISAPDFIREVVSISSLELHDRPPTATPKWNAKPYKHLDYFEQSEATIFYGRSKETQRLTDLCLAHRVLVLTGASGTGKTSLLNAGLLPAIQSMEDYKAVYARVENDPTASIRRGLSLLFPQILQSVGPNSSLIEYLYAAKGATTAIPVIIIDQGEELFVRVGEALREDLLATIRFCVTSATLIARFVLSLRDDYLPRLTEFRDRLPTIMNNVMWLSDLDRDSAIEAIRLPAENASVTFDLSLAHRILDEIGLTSFPPPQIQIICSTLYETMAAETIDDILYDRLGGASRILRGFLDQELSRLGPAAENARRVLKAMVTAEGTKDVLPLDIIARRAHLSFAEAQDVVFHLRDHSRLVRGVHTAEGSRFELSHEYLTSDIIQWMSDEEKRHRTVEDLMERELRSWRRFRQLRLGVDRLKVFELNADIVHYDTDALTMLLLSSIKHYGHAEIWAPQIAQVGSAEMDYIADVLFGYFEETDVNLRREAAEAMACLDSDCLIRALSSKSVVKQQLALEISGGIRLAAAEPLICTLTLDPNEGTAVLACGALGELQGEQAIVALDRASHSRSLKIATAAIRAAGRCKHLMAVAIVARALESDDTSIREAGGLAVAQSRFSMIVQQLLLSYPLTRDAVVAAIIEAPQRLVPWVKPILDRLPEALLDQLFRTYIRPLCWDALDQLTKMNSVFAYAAHMRGQTGYKDWDYKAAESAATSVELAVSKWPNLGGLRSLMEDGSWYEKDAIRRRLSDGSSSATSLIETMIQSDTRSLVVEGFRAIYNSKLPISLPLGTIEEGLAHTSATIRYFCCLAASRQPPTTAILDALRYLVDDKEEANNSISRIGAAVRDAASRALDQLSPLTKVWRKPFQRTFRIVKS